MEEGEFFSLFQADDLTHYFVFKKNGPKQSIGFLITSAGTSGLWISTKNYAKY